MMTDFYNIWYRCNWENLQPKNLFHSYNIQFVYEYYRIEKQKRDSMLSMQKRIKNNSTVKHEKKPNIA